MLLLGPLQVRLVDVADGHNRGVFGGWVAIFSPSPPHPTTATPMRSLAPMILLDEAAVSIRLPLPTRNNSRRFHEFGLLTGSKY